MPDRHHDVTRLEGFSDGIFAIALALLVVSLEVPKTMAELEELARGFVPFALMFAMVCWVWYEHNKFFRRYGMQDAWTVFLNSVLLLVVLFYVYPLKFLTMWLLGGMFGLVERPRIDTGDQVEILMLRYGMRAHVFRTGIGITSILITLSPIGSMFAGLVYALMGPLHALNGYQMGAAMAALERKAGPGGDERDRA